MELMWCYSRHSAVLLLLIHVSSMLAFSRVDAFSSVTPVAVRPSHVIVPPQHHPQQSVSPWTLFSASAASTSNVIDTDDMETETTSKGLLKRDRYFVMNRFAVRAGKAAKMEQRWATRKSRLASLPGFRYFHLMRRVSNTQDKQQYYDEGDSDESAQENYVSFTIWEKKSDFSAWRKGDAFKEAHGGTSIGAFLSTMVNSALILRGPPRPAFYDGLLVQAVPPKEIPETVDGWRQVEANGIDTLPAECFVELTKYYVASDQAKAFEEFWQKETLNQQSLTPSVDGFVVSTILRRDGQATDNSQKGLHGMGSTNNEKKKNAEPSYVRVAIFNNREAFDRAKNDKTMPQLTATPPKPLFLYDPETYYYEGTLVIADSKGA